jgi:hypothetical protein
MKNTNALLPLSVCLSLSLELFSRRNLLKMCRKRVESLAGFVTGPLNLELPTGGTPTKG